jgi:hypothetical protein
VIEGQKETAVELGYGGDVQAMNMDHDALHGALCHFLDIPSYSLADGRGERLSSKQKQLAELEEQAVMACQKLRQMHRVLV